MLAENHFCITWACPLFSPEKMQLLLVKMRRPEADIVLFREEYWQMCADFRVARPAKTPGMPV
jgi:hypothetical protein